MAVLLEQIVDQKAKAMQLITTDKARDLGAMLEGYECPAILVSADYQILATNQNYREAFGEIELESES